MPFCLFALSKLPIRYLSTPHFLIRFFYILNVKTLNIGSIKSFYPLSSNSRLEKVAKKHEGPYKDFLIPMQGFVVGKAYVKNKMQG